MPAKYRSEVVECGKQKFYMDGGLRTFLHHGIDRVEKRKKDFWAIVGGHEGDGKTTFAFQCSTYVDPDFDLSQVAFTGDQFIKIIRKSKPGQAIVYDEAVTGMSNDDTWKEVNRKILKAAVMCRKRRLYIFICIPTIFLLRWYIAYERSNYYAYVYEKDGKPGRFRFYNRRLKRKCYMKGRRDHKHIYTPLRGRFTAYWPTAIDEDEYDKMKDAGWDLVLADDDPGGYSVDKLRLGACLRYLKHIRGDRWQNYPRGMGMRTISTVLLHRTGLKLSRDVIREYTRLPLPGKVPDISPKSDALDVKTQDNAGGGG